MAHKRSIAIVLLLSTVLLVLGGLALPWWTGGMEAGSLSIDLRKMTMCVASVCGDKALVAADASAGAWAKIGTSTFAASLVTAILTALCAWRVLRRTARTHLYWTTGALALFTGLLALLFVFLHPDLGEMSPSYGLACTLAGAFLGGLSASAAARSQRSL